MRGGEVRSSLGATCSFQVFTPPMAVTLQFVEHTSCPGLPDLAKWLAKAVACQAEVAVSLNSARPPEASWTSTSTIAKRKTCSGSPSDPRKPRPKARWSTPGPHLQQGAPTRPDPQHAEMPLVLPTDLARIPHFPIDT